MGEVIDRGHMFIAQPPLFKVSQGKKDTYLKDEAEKSRFSLTRVAESVEITPQAGGAGSRGEKLRTMLHRMEGYRNHASKLQARGTPSAALDVLFHEGFSDRTAINDPDKLASLANALEAAGFEHVRQLTDAETETPILQFSAGGNGAGRKVTANHELLSMSELRQMAKAFGLFAAYGLPPYAVKHGEEAMTFTNVDNLLAHMYRVADNRLSISRHKT